MTVLLVLFTLILLLTIDHFIQRAKRRATAAAALSPYPSIRFPEGLGLAANHTWARRESGGLLTVGLDEFLGRFVGAVDTILLPTRGSSLTPAGTSITLQHQKRSLALAVPVEGEVVEVNHALARDPSLFRNDPYGKGWLVKMRLAPAANHTETLLEGRAAAQWLKDQVAAAKEFLRMQMSHSALALMQDGGVPTEGILSHLDEEAWKEFERHFAALPVPTER